MIQFINQYWIFAIGFAAQGVFALRMGIQWLFSESKGKSESPVVFWQLSLLGSFLLLLYGCLRNDVVIVVGQTLSYFIFIRNLMFHTSWRIIFFPLRAVVVCPPIAIIGYVVFNRQAFFSLSYAPDTFSYFFIIGMAGQLLMSLRFVHQWYVAEKTKVSELPVAFWYITLLGSILIIVYGIVYRDPVLLVAQGFSLVSAVRNIQLLKRSVTG